MLGYAHAEDVERSKGLQMEMLSAFKQHNIEKKNPIHLYARESNGDLSGRINIQ